MERIDALFEDLVSYTSPCEIWQQTVTEILHDQEKRLAFYASELLSLRRRCEELEEQLRPVSVPSGQETFRQRFYVGTSGVAPICDSKKIGEFNNLRCCFEKGHTNDHNYVVDDK